MGGREWLSAHSGRMLLCASGPANHDLVLLFEDHVSLSQDLEYVVIHVELPSRASRFEISLLTHFCLVSDAFQDLLVFEVDVGPPQRDEFAVPRPTVQREEEVVAVERIDGVKESPGFGGREGVGIRGKILII